MKRSRKPINPVSERRARYLEELRDITPAVMERAGYRCEVRLDGCLTIPQETPHHRLQRSHQGPNEMWNLAAACTRCHDRIHLNPAWSYENGWLLKSGTVDISAGNEQSSSN